MDDHALGAVVVLNLLEFLSPDGSRSANVCRHLQSHVSPMPNWRRVGSHAQLVRFKGRRYLHCRELIALQDPSVFVQ